MILQIVQDEGGFFLVHFTWMWHFTSIAWVSFIRIRRYGILFFFSTSNVLKSRRMTFHGQWLNDSSRFSDGHYRATIELWMMRLCMIATVWTVASIFRARPLFFFSSFVVFPNYACKETVFSYVSFKVCTNNPCPNKSIHWFLQLFLGSGRWWSRCIICSNARSGANDGRAQKLLERTVRSFLSVFYCFKLVYAMQGFNWGGLFKTTC